MVQLSRAAARSNPSRASPSNRQNLMRREKSTRTASFVRNLAHPISILSLSMATIFACGAVGVNAADFTRQRAGSGLAYRPSIQVELRESLSSENSQPADSLLAGFYAARDFAPVWIGSFEAERMAEEVRAALREAPRNGLSSADYASPTLRRELTSRNGREAVEYEIALTKSLL